MKVHPIVGAEILERVDFPYPVVPIVRAHHEKWDGSGYPSGLKGEAIPIGARILSAVDCLDALSSDRQYRKALPLDEAMLSVASEAGTSFDPRVVEILQRRYVELEKLAREQPLQAPPKLSTDIRVERGLAPATGFAESAESVGEVPVKNHTAIMATARQPAQALRDLCQQQGAQSALDHVLSLLAVAFKPLLPSCPLPLHFP